MAKHRLRRSFQFGILDLLLLQALVAVMIVLSWPSNARVCEAKPWLFGYWDDPLGGSVVLFPEWIYCRLDEEGRPRKLGNWSIRGEQVFIEGEEQAFVLRREVDSAGLTLLSEDGKVQLEQHSQLVGQMREGKPHGTWTSVGRNAGNSLEYRRWGLFDARRSDGTKDQETIEMCRYVRTMLPSPRPVR